MLLALWNHFSKRFEALQIPNESVSMSRQETIQTTLEAAFQPERLIVIDESEHHAGHLPAGEDGPETHMRVRIVSSRFEGMARIARHRAINDALAEEFKGGLHALAVEAAAPGEKTRW